MSIAVTFPGQGSQSPGAGRCWRQTVGWRLVDEGSQVLDRDLAELLVDTCAAELQRPWEAQVSTFLVSLLVWTAWRDGVHDEPAALAGHSLGEWTAMVASGAVDFAAGLRLVSARGTAMAAAAAARPGTMAALVGADDAAVDQACAAAHEVWPANYNAPGQVVISGDGAGFAGVGAAAGARRVLPLPVGGAYHTPYMASARVGLVTALAAHQPGVADIPVWSNVDAAPHIDGFADRLAEQLTSPVRWRQTIEALLVSGVDEFIELGPGAVLTGLAKRNAPGATLRRVATPEELG